MKAHYLAYGLLAFIMLVAALAASADMPQNITHYEKIEKIELSLHVTQQGPTLKTM